MGTLVQTCVDKDDLIIAISPDNKILASAGSEVQLWDATTGMQEMDESNLATNASCIFAFTLDGKCWRTIEDYWPEYTAQQRVTTPQIVEEDCTIYTAIAFSANGQALALGAWHIMHLVPTESPCEIRVALEDGASWRFWAQMLRLLPRQQHTGVGTLPSIQS
ncbi:hypothetical protein ACHAPX_000242 [Trichoderma viride]